jgi:hypothetical protein
MIATMKQFTREPHAARPLPPTRQALKPAKATFREFSDGRCELLLDGSSAGIYASKQRAREGRDVFRRMGVAR